MNWTGGTLQRSKSVNKGVLQKQKAYFAKARTNLQKEPDSPIAPFRPSYLQNEDNLEVTGLLPSFGSGSVRHTGHSARRHREGLDPEPILGLRRNLSREDAKHPGKRGYSELVQKPALLSPRKEEEEKGENEADYSDPEFQLLEAKRKRLLRQNDWIGVAPSRPLNLRFLTGKEKAKVGRRRRVSGKHGAVARLKDGDGSRMPAVPHMKDSRTGLTQQIPDEIRIRIGTDALTTACSTQPEGLNRSHASSEPMLFDQQTPQTDARGALGSGISNLFDTLRPGSVFSDMQVRSPRIHTCPASPMPNLHYPTLLKTSMNQAHLESTEDFVGGPRSSREHSIRTPCIMQQVKGTTHPLRLVFDDSVSPLGHSRREESRDGGEVLDRGHAGVSHSGTTHALGNVPDSQSKSEATTAAVVDNRSWKSLIDIPVQSSSRATMSSQREKRIVQHQATARRQGVESMDWSQHATQGNEMHSSSIMSTSLPSLQYGAQGFAPVQAHKGNSEKRDAHELSEDEKQWQDFIFGSDKVSSPVEHRENSTHISRRDSSGYLPLSAAVSSIRSTPFTRTLKHLPHMDDAARFAPPGSRPVATAGFVEEMSDDDHQSERMRVRSALGEQSLTHASMQNNASGETDAIYSRTLSNTETSRSGLDNPGYRSDSLFARTQASSSGSRRGVKRVSIWDLPDSEDGEVHIIDRSSL